MFTGIINHIGRIESAEQNGDLRITVSTDWPELTVGESIACNGACLTVVEKGARAGRHYFTADLSAETVSRTAPRWNAGDALNMERALRLGDALDGHMVTGHVDGIATIADIADDGGSHILNINAPAKLSRFIAEKGSVTLDGVSLTVNSIRDTRFTVNIIPHTWRVTTLGQRKAGDALNIEIDMVARYVARLLGQQEAA